MKRDLYFSKPIMNAAGTLGFSPDFRILKELGILDYLGAFVTNPISLRPRLPATQPGMTQFPGGILLHTGLPNPGLSSVIKKHGARWDHSEIPVIAHLMSDDPEETRKMTRSLENIENVMAVELGFAPHTSSDVVLSTLQMCAGELPLIFSLPAAQVLSLGAKLIQRGADAISLATPRGAVMDGDTLVTGRLYGQSIFPHALEVIHAAKKIGLPLIGAGGVWTEKDAADMLSAGALAVQVDIKLWKPSES
jgi:dihydroorotate dehydrogenase (NAD+) catalytic subunit